MVFTGVSFKWHFQFKYRYHLLDLDITTRSGLLDVGDISTVNCQVTSVLEYDQCDIQPCTLSLYQFSKH